ncbi:helix-turn-helix domain-containing protein [Nonomuraea rhodomycinica]|uniref:Helix-turn-helix transcriptional regulator n=1 Tax=Nonomuraea rhodomycinica TaxID=1712872 RepID=A0A7Y6IWZ8_9ACTN|nr:AraC family transcriptional regulator [Nonomuraea rhodomycinica]NUW45398.1 helix-turn-helix transcriptional regulator [Nonomuraea rhodomycinica]
MTADDMSVPAAELIIVGHFDRAPGYVTRRPGGSPSWLVMWTQAGSGLVEQGGASFTAGPGDLVVLASGAAQHYRVAPGAERWRFWWAHFQPRPSWPGWLAPYARAAGCHLVAGVPVALHERLDQAFRRALRDARWLPPADPARPDATRLARRDGADLARPDGADLARREVTEPAGARHASPTGPGSPAGGAGSPVGEAGPVAGRSAAPGGAEASRGEQTSGGAVRARVGDRAWAPETASDAGTALDAEMERDAGTALDAEMERDAGTALDAEMERDASGAVAGSAAARELVLGAVEEVLVLATASARRPGDGDGGGDGGGGGGDGRGGDPRVRRALALIAAEPGAPHSVASLARAVALSPSRFAHLFTSETGAPPMRAVRQARIRHAARLLEATDMDVGQVATASGFVSPFHFSRAFRQEYGLPPRAYRRTRQEADRAGS